VIASGSRSAVLVVDTERLAVGSPLVGGDIGEGRPRNQLSTADLLEHAALGEPFTSG
jgi:hypothetical protein